MKQVIYEPHGKAAEFSQLALNIYSGCTNGCTYCYAPIVLHRDRKQFHAISEPRVSLAEVETSAAKFKGDKRNILLCFTSDPLQPNTILGTQAVISILHKYNLHVTVLTKNADKRILDCLDTMGDELAVTLTYTMLANYMVHEPNSSSPSARLRLLQAAHGHGIRTWVSLEPVISEDCAISLIIASQEFAGHYKIGKMNYQPDTVNWKVTLPKIEALLQSLQKPYYIKDSISRQFGKPGGYWWPGYYSPWEGVK